MKKHEKQLQLDFDSWETRENTLCEYYKGTWKESLWNKNVWYYQTKIGYTAYDNEHRSTHKGTMLPQKIN